MHLSHVSADYDVDWLFWKSSEATYWRFVLKFLLKVGYKKVNKIEGMSADLER